MELNIERIEQSIVSEVVDRLVDEEHLSDLISSQVKARIDKMFSESVNAKIQEAIDRAIKEGFHREYSKVDSWGRPVGEPTTLALELSKQVEGYWNQRVDSNGAPKTDSYGKVMTRAEWLMFKICSEDFNALMKQHIVNAAGFFKDGLRASLNETVNECLSSVLRVSSLGDQGLPRTGSACIDPKAKKID